MSDFATAYPNSRKVYVDGLQGVKVPVREIALSGGEPAFTAYDTSGPQEHDVATGLPRLREPWVKARAATARASEPVTQLHYAQGRHHAGNGFIAVREGLPPNSSATSAPRPRDHSREHQSPGARAMIIGRIFW